MWPAQSWTPGGGAPSTDPLCRESTKDGNEDHEFRVLAAPLLTPGPVTLAPGENSTDDSIDFSKLMTKPKTIIESPGASVWETNFGRLSNSQSVPNLSSSNCFGYEINSEQPTTLSSSDSLSLPQSQSSKLS